MMEGVNWGWFIVASGLLILTPGPAVLYIVTRGVSEGWRNGIVSAWGVGLANLIHALIAGLGLSMLVVSSPQVFRMIQFGGAGYLVMLGIQRWMRKPCEATQQAGGQRSAAIRVFVQGWVVGMLNPKTIVFFLAFLPQFVDQSMVHLRWPFVSLGFIFVLMALVGDSTWALVSGWVGAALDGKSWRRFERVLSGGIYCLLGAVAVWSA
ncbi:MAG: LysE family translocator [Opitutales bacterium]|nr:LysE family translocator [Opitutales bacterium]